MASKVHAEPEVEEPIETELELHPEPVPLPPMEPTAAAIAGEPEMDGDFNVSRLSPEEQELHRRANRVAKVSMQDIKMLRPEQVRIGREKKDLCIRLKDDIEKAHREYDRRFKPIMDHPVDYFYRWMVEILADGDAHALATTLRHARTPSLIACGPRGFLALRKIPYYSVLLCCVSDRVDSCCEFVAGRGCRYARAIFQAKAQDEKAQGHALPDRLQARDFRPNVAAETPGMKRHKENFRIWRGRCATEFPVRTRGSRRLR